MDVKEIIMLVAAVLMLISAILSFVTAFFGNGKRKKSSVKEKAKGAVTDFSDGEFRLMLAKYLKETERAQKELVDLMKQQSEQFRSEIENLEHEIYLLSEKQVNQSKSIIKFNKENARQLAISERETLEYVMAELKKAIEGNGKAPAEEEEVPEVSPEEFDLSALFDDIAEGAAMEEAAAEPVIPEPVPVIEDIPEPVPVIEDIPELAPVAEEIKEEPEPAPDPLAGLGGDPNAMMTPEDIAKLLEAMGQ